MFKIKDKAEGPKKKILFIEDVDNFFADEEDFHVQLTKLIMQSRVPIIISASSRDKVNEVLV